MKVFGIGLNKTGTSSLGRFFQNNGYKMHEDYSCLKIQLAKNLITKKDMKKSELILDIVENADVFEDWPWPLIYKQCLERYPDAKFILTVRDSPEQWFDSLYHHCKRLGPTRQIKAIYGHYTPNNSTKKDFIEYYTRHNKEVVEFFSDKPGKLLILPTSMDNDKKADKIIAHVCFDDHQASKFTNKKFPVANKRKPSLNQKESKVVDYPQVYTDEVCRLLFETQDYISQSFINYSLLDIMIANLKKSGIEEEYQKKSTSFDMFVKSAIRFAMKLNYRQAIIYFIKTYKVDVNEPIDISGHSIVDFAKAKNPKLLSAISKLVRIHKE